jgi:predicted phage baseplate assembly protein
VLAEHSNRAPSAILGVSNGKPDQRFQVELRPVMPRDSTEYVAIVTGDGTSTRWTEVPDFADSDKDDLHFTWDSTSGTIAFGPNIRYPDGTARQHGAIPPEGGRVTVTGYRHGGGQAGNVGPRTVTSLRSTISYVAKVENLEAASGGVDAETVANAKLRGPQTLRAGGRAVTKADYERLAMEADPSIGRVRCLPPKVSGKPIRLLLVPKAEPDGPQLTTLDDFALPAGMVGRVGNYLDHRRILGTTVEIGTPFYQGVSIAVLVTRSPLRPLAFVRERVLQALFQFVDPLTGGGDGQGWPFDTDLNVASIYQLIEAVDGVERVDEALLFEYDLRTKERVGAAKELIKLEDQSLFLSAAHRVVVQ